MGSSAAGMSSSMAGGTSMATGGTGAAGMKPAGTGGMSGGSAGMTTGGAGMASATGGKGSSGMTGGSGTSAGGTSAGGTSAGGTSAAGSGMGGASGGAFKLTSMAYKDGMLIDSKYRCSGPSPDAMWSGAPSGTMSFALELQDKTPGISMDFVHWLIYDIPASVTSIPEMIATGYAPAMPAGAHQGPNYNGQSSLGFTGPCGPFGTNTYEFTLYALDVATLPGLSMSSTSAEITTALTGSHKLASTKITIMSMP